MKNEIKVGDKVVFLFDTTLHHGTCTKVNGKTFKIHAPKQSCYSEFTKNVAKHRVANVNDEFTMVCEVNRGPEGAYRIDYDTYPTENKTWQHWAQPCYYKMED